MLKIVLRKRGKKQHLFMSGAGTDILNNATSFRFVATAARIHVTQHSKVGEALTSVLTGLHFTVDNTSIFTILIYMMHFSNVTRFLNK